MRKSSRTSRSSSTHHCNPRSPSIIIAASSVPFELVRASIPIDPPHPHQPPPRLVPNQDDEAQRFNVGQSQPDRTRSVTLTPPQRARGLYREPGSSSRHPHPRSLPLVSPLSPLRYRHSCRHRSSWYLSSQSRTCICPNPPTSTFQQQQPQPQPQWPARLPSSLEPTKASVMRSFDC